MKVVGTTYLGSRDGAEYWAEGEACTAEIQRTDENEVRIGIQLRESESDDASLYLTVAEASRLAHYVSVAVMAHELAGHEAAKLESQA